MGRIQPAQGNWKLMEVDVPAAGLPVELVTQAKLSMLSKETCWYCVPFMNMNCRYT